MGFAYILTAKWNYEWNAVNVDDLIKLKNIKQLSSHWLSIVLVLISSTTVLK